MKTSIRFLFPFLLVALLDSSYGQTPTPTQSPDIAPSGYIDMMDLFVLSENWKAATGPQYGDLDDNGTVGAEDLLSLLADWHKSVPPTGETLTINIPNLPSGARPMKLVRIPAGTFQMGSPNTESGRDYDEGPVHTVNITHDFYIGETEVTQAQWQAIMGSNPASSNGGGNDYPVYYLSWNDCQSFLSALNALGQGSFRLPSEAEWEYACRAGTQTRFSFGDNLSCDDECGACPLAAQYMWWCGNSGSTSHPVASKLANDFHLYDMHGNVWEWCQDWYHTSYSGAPTDGSSWNSQQSRYPYRVLRGGGWGNSAGYCRSALRGLNSPDGRYDDFGFRLARTP